MRALKRFGIHPAFAEYISSIPSGVQTTISVGNKSTGLIEVRRGVKQGDPLSPVLFNLVMDELICKLNYEKTGGTIALNAKVAAVAFTDDIVLL